MTPPQILGVFLLHQTTHVGVSPSRGLKLFGSEIIFQRIPTYASVSMSGHLLADDSTAEELLLKGDAAN